MNADLLQAVTLLKAGELVGIPTETVYGLAADASNPAAVAKIFAAKGRPADHPLIVHVAGADQLDVWAREIPPTARQLATAFWPGPLTLILKRQPGVPDAVTGGQDTVGLRVPDHPLTLDLLRAFGGGLAAPSANRFGRISPTTATHVRNELGERVALVLDGGPCQVGIESTIVDLSRGHPVILRPGAITAEDIQRVLHQSVSSPGSPSVDGPRVSGSLAAHYAPVTPMQLLDTEALRQAAGARVGAGLPCGVFARQAPLESDLLTFVQASADPATYAHDLYGVLRDLDAAKVGLILVEATPDSPEWLAIADRLGRSACGAGKD